MKQFNLSLVLMAAMLLAGCASTAPAPTTITINDPAMQALNGIASNAVSTQEELAAMQSAVELSKVTPSGLKAAQYSDTATPAGWGKPFSLSYTGSINNLFTLLCEQSGYRYYGVPNQSNPPIVTVTGKNVPLIHYLRAAIAELPDDYNVRLYSQNKTVVVHHG